MKKEYDLVAYLNSLEEGESITVTCDLLMAMEEVLRELSKYEDIEDFD